MLKLVLQGGAVAVAAWVGLFGAQAAAATLAPISLWGQVVADSDGCTTGPGTCNPYADNYLGGYFDSPRQPALDFTGAGAFTQSSTFNTTSTVTASAILSPYPVIQLSASTESVAGEPDYSFVYGQIHLYYEMQVTGPEGAVVPIRIQSHGAANTSAQGQATILVNLVNELASAGPGHPGAPTSFDVDSVYDFSANQAYGVWMDVYLAGYSPYLSGLTESHLVYVDPIFTIDPDFERTGLYRLEFSSGIGGVPEPATWALLLGGFGLAGASLRHRRATVLAK